MEYTIVDIQDNAGSGKTYIVKDENNTPSFKYLTGIGIVSPEPLKDHLSLDYIFLPLYGPLAEANSTSHAYWCHLVGVYDKEDNLIYAGRLDLLGVEGLPDDDKFAGVQSPVYFNLQGQPVTNPEKGNLYIERTSASARKILF